MKKIVFIFRRDLRLIDNLGLKRAFIEGEVIPIFIFDPIQIDNNQFRSDNALQFLLESLSDLEKQITEFGGKLHFFYDRPEKIVTQLINFGIKKIASRKY